MQSPLVNKDNLTVLRLHVVPGSKLDAIVGLYGADNRLKIKIKAPATESKANSYLLEFLANTLKLSKSELSIERGLHSNKKDILINKDIDSIFSL